MKSFKEHTKLNEASYPGNIGIMELIKFKQKANDEQKKKFFTLVKGVQTELAERAKIKEAELKGGQKQLDVDGDGEIEGSDLAKLRAKK